MEFSDSKNLNQRNNENSNQSFISIDTNSQLFLNILELSYFFQNDSQFKHSENAKTKYGNLTELLDNIFKDLTIKDSFIFVNSNQNLTENEIYRFLAAVLNNLIKNNYFSEDKHLISEYNFVKNQLTSLQNKYNNLIQKLNPQFKEETDLNSNLNEIEKYKEMEKEVSKLIFYLKHHFNLSDSTNLYNIIDAINIHCTCGISEKDRIDQLMMQNQDLENRLMKIQNEKYEIEKKLIDQKTECNSDNNSQVMILQNEINTLKDQLKNVSQKYENKKVKIQLMSQSINQQEETIKKLSRDLENSSIKYNKLLIENDDNPINKKNDIKNVSQNDLKIKEDEINNLNLAINELSVQLEKMNEDLMAETTMKNHLFNALQSQNYIMNNFEETIKEKLKIKNEVQYPKIQLKSIITNDENENEDKEEEITNNLFSSLAKSKLDKFEIENLTKVLQNKDLDLKTRLSTISNSLINSINNNAKKIDDQNELEINNEESSKQQIIRLKKYLANLIYFIEKVTSSGEMQEFFIESTIDDSDFREKLIAQCHRIEAFMKDNGIHLEEEYFILENNDISDSNILDITNFSESVKEQIESPDSEELLLLLRQFAFINDSIRRYADEMKQQAERYLSDIKQLRYQINEKEEQYTDELNKANNTLQNEIQEKKILNSIISEIQTILREASISEKKEKKEEKVIINNDEVLFEEEEEDIDYYENYSREENNNNTNNDLIFKCLEIIQNGLQNESISKEISFGTNKIDNQNMYISKLEKYLTKEREKRKIFEGKANEEINKLQNKIKALKKQACSDKQKFIEEIEYAKKQFDDLSKTISDSPNSSKYQNEIEEKENLIESLNKQIKQQDEEIIQLKNQFDMEKEKIIENYQNERQKLFQEKDDQINTLMTSLESTQTNTEEKVKEVKQDLKKTIKKLQNEINIENERANNIKNHYESLLEKIKEKLAQSRESEQSANEKANNFEIELKQAKSTISKLRIDVKMLQLKINAADDRLTREKSLFDSQLKMKILGMQSDHHDRINELKEKYENDIHKLHMKICEIFKDYIDYNMTFSEESVLNILHQVSHALNQSNQKILQKKSSASLLNDIKTMLNISNDNEIISTLTNIINEANEYIDKKAKIENCQKKANILLRKAKAINNNENNAREWEIWAKRLYSLVTENFSNAKTMKQLQCSIEETLLSAIGQRQSWKKLEILRKEKEIFTSGLLNKVAYKKDNSCQSLISIMASLIFIYRMQKLAGHLKFNIDLSPKKDNS